jgi:hypothetical protein
MPSNIDSIVAGQSGWRKTQGENRGFTAEDGEDAEAGRLKPSSKPETFTAEDGEDAEGWAAKTKFKT